MPNKRNLGSIIDIRGNAGDALAKINDVVFRAHNIPTGMYDVKDEKLNREIVVDRMLCSGSGYDSKSSVSARWKN